MPRAKGKKAASSSRAPKDVPPPSKRSRRRAPSSHATDEESDEPSRRRKTAPPPPLIPIASLPPPIAYFAKEPSYRVTYSGLHQKPMVRPRVFDPVALTSAGVWDEILELLWGDWAVFFSIREGVHSLLTYEVLSTLTIEHTIRDPDYRFSFMACGKRRQMSIGQLGVALGFWSEEFLDTTEYHALPLQAPASRDRHAFWNAHSVIGAPDLHSKKCKATSLKSPAWKVVHNVIAHSLHFKPRNSTTFNLNDLSVFYSMATRTRVNTAVEVAGMLVAQQSSSVGGITCGPIITMMARYLGCTSAELAPFGPFIPAFFEPISSRTIQRLKLEQLHPSGGGAHVTPPIDTAVDTETDAGGRTDAATDAETDGATDTDSRVPPRHPPRPTFQ
ncbi:unnamed protein product [Cuscuta epithymum]|uniref:Uncharacterized protein n=1 Tax=Cuscuta epithymum TaxID=186058 RepID=A0AAV0FH26_9ASTE|nr:unnamed protein product [Cuscuta epithymum]